MWILKILLDAILEWHLKGCLFIWLFSIQNQDISVNLMIHILFKIFCKGYTREVNAIYASLPSSLDPHIKHKLARMKNDSTRKIKEKEIYSIR